MPDKPEHDHTVTHTQLEAAFSEYDALRAENEELNQAIINLKSDITDLKEDVAERDAENEHLREELAEWQATTVAELRGLIESHMDMARGEWRCEKEKATFGTVGMNYYGGELVLLKVKVERLRQALQEEYAEHQAQADDLTCSAGNFDAGSPETCEHCGHLRRMAALAPLLS